MSIQQDKENNMNLWKFIEKILDFILCKLLRLKINKTQWELLMQFVKSVSYTHLPKGQNFEIKIQQLL